ncbi:hypothetical protein ILUMI_03930 [Ignelater luminosus]|uniref:Protein croquemort n=1 Tax=Ignelater luminosus TaxID=2038154 RepID=A0A8K0D9W2_IGNLU|nr:hypothetical protein ILUMI_03930 [Ignelater luminosus]
MGFCGKRCGAITLFSTGTILIILGLVLALFWGSLYNQILSNELILTNHSRSYELWKETPIPMYLSLYLFNWTNAGQVLQSKWAVKPELQECGPYVFSEHHIRVNLLWNDNGTVTYQQKRIWHFIPELSNGSLSDKITNLNPVVATIGSKIKDLNSSTIRKLVNFALKGLEHSIVTTKTVDELLFTGFDDNVLQVVSKLKIKGLDIPFTKFGWFYMRNNSATYDGTFTIYTGKTDLQRVGIMDLWNGQARTSYYDNYCGDINGTSGELWPPVKDYQEVAIFSSDICSSITITYNSTEVVDGVAGKKYVGTDYVFDNGTKYPEQACYYSKPTPSGIRDVSKCRFGAPLFVSYPHFYLADPVYKNAVKGLHPDKTKHEMYITLEPSSGIPLDARAQLQINLFVEPIESMSMFENIKPTYMPMLWFSQTATLTNKYAHMVRVLLVMDNVGLYVGWTAFGVGLLSSLIAIFIICRQEWHEKEEERLLDNEQPQS